MGMKFTINAAGIDYMDEVKTLFDQYRVFYGQQSNMDGCSDFINERCRLNDSKVFIAIDEETTQGVGFVQLYPSFSSVAMRRVWILNDLFVTPGARNNGVAKALLERARKFAEETGAVRVTLATAVDNIIAQKLYESLSYIRDEHYYHYTLNI